jgi:hypothetical protein
MVAHAITERGRYILQHKRSPVNRTHSETAELGDAAQPGETAEPGDVPEVARSESGDTCEWCGDVLRKHTTPKDAVTYETVLEDGKKCWLYPTDDLDVQWLMQLNYNPQVERTEYKSGEWRGVVETWSRTTMSSSIDKLKRTDTGWEGKDAGGKRMTLSTAWVESTYNDEDLAPCQGVWEFVAVGRADTSGAVPCKSATPQRAAVAVEPVPSPFVTGRASGSAGTVPPRHRLRGPTHCSS